MNVDQSAVSHQQNPSSYSQYDQPEPRAQSPQAYEPSKRSYYSSTPNSQQQYERSYTLGGGGYGDSTVPALHADQQHDYMPYPSDAYDGYAAYSSPLQVATAVSTAPTANTSPIKGPRAQRKSVSQYPENPPDYVSQVSGAYKGNY